MMTTVSEITLQPGARIGNYVLQERIGEGAFAQVWKAAHHERPDRVVAVKVAVDEAFRRQLAREGRVPDLDHPNVVPILDSDTRFAEIPYLVMPYLSGGSLADLIARHAQGLPEKDVERLLGDILAGLAAAHRRGIVHRDIKPQNVLLNNDGRALISDFGLSLPTFRSEGARSIIQSASLSLEHDRSLAGTLTYMAPEVLEGAAATPAADIYSVGVMLFEMLVGRRPAGLELPTNRRRDLEQANAWSSLYLRACSPIEERFADAAKMADALDELGLTLVEPADDALETFSTVTRLKGPSVRPVEAPPSPRRAEARKKRHGGSKLALVLVLCFVGFRTCRSFESSSTPPPRTYTPGAPFRLPPDSSEQKAAKLRQQQAAEQAGLSITRLLDLGGGERMEFVFVPAGSFVMGSDEGDSDEQPPHEVQISRPFYLGRGEVTQGQWQAVMGKGRNRFPREDLPMDSAAWEDGQEFCRQLTARLGRAFRLPTEAEWEYACRADGAGRYCFGTDETLLRAYAWYAGNHGDGTRPPATRQPNAWGLCDMYGNVWEWCEDWYDRYPGSVAESGDFGQKSHVARGGSWCSDSVFCRSAQRGGPRPDYSSGSVGLRIATGVE